MDKTEEVKDLLEILNSDDLEDRIMGIQILGEIGDEEALRALRQRMAPVSEEHYALVVAIGKLKRRLRLK